MTPTTSSSASSPNGETDMHDIDIEEQRRLLGAATPGQWRPKREDVGDRYEVIITRLVGDRGASVMHLSGGFGHPNAADLAHIISLHNNAAAMFDAIETGRQWETTARRLAEDLECAQEQWGDDYLWGKWNLSASLTAFRDLADRTPTPTDGA